MIVCRAISFLLQSDGQTDQIVLRYQSNDTSLRQTEVRAFHPFIRRDNSIRFLAL